MVVHIRDWHYVPREMCEAEGIDFAANLAIVQSVQMEQNVIARDFMRSHGRGRAKEEIHVFLFPIS